MYITTKALVLREVKYREADKILTVLTESEGKLTVNARGALRKGSRIRAASQFLTFSEMTLFCNKGRWSLDEAETIEQFLGLRQDICLLALASYFAELLEAVSDGDSASPELLRLGLNTLYALSRGKYSPEHIKSAFELRIMCLSGYEPELSACGACGKVDITFPVFSLTGGTVYCRECRLEEGNAGLSLCAGSLAAMRHIVNSGPKRVFSFSLGHAAQKMLGDICEAYVCEQLERGFRSLDYYKSLN
ncbi:MAG TPA: DNA repair protein RecO [Clostridiales bacterium]|nr:DNA repair protein RecO [Clostridiales bacterium]